MIDRALIRASLRTHRKNPLHLPLPEIPGPNIRAAQIASGGLSVQAEDQVIAIDTPTHVAGDHEGEPAEHPPFGHVSSSRPCATHPLPAQVIPGHPLPT